MPGVDQINVRLPEDILARGCYVGLSVSTGDVSSNNVSLALSDDGSPCDHPWGLSAARMAEIEAGARATYVTLDLSDGISEVENPLAFSGSQASSAFGQASTLNEAGLEGASRRYGFGLNNIIPASRLTCPAGNAIAAWINVGAFGPIGGPTEPIPSPPAPPNPPRQGADSGPLWRLSGPGGRTLELPAPEPNPFWSSDTTFLSAQEEPGFLTPGEWTLTTPGGADIAPLETALSMPGVPEFAGPEVIRRGEAFEVTWRPEDLPPTVEAEVQLFFRRPINAENSEGGGGFSFSCRVDNIAGRVLISFEHLLQNLEGFEQAELTFRVTAVGPEAHVPGIDRVETKATAFRTWPVSLE